LVALEHVPRRGDAIRAVVRRGEGHQAEPIGDGAIGDEREAQRPRAAGAGDARQLDSKAIRTRLTMKEVVDHPRRRVGPRDAGVPREDAAPAGEEPARALRTAEDHTVLHRRPGQATRGGEGDLYRSSQLVARGTDRQRGIPDRDSLDDVVASDIEGAKAASTE